MEGLYGGYIVQLRYTGRGVLEIMAKKMDAITSVGG